MSQQNVYDNEIFFNGYKKIRGNSGNANELIEKPALFSLIPNLQDKTVIDLGCGYGENCVEYINLGAKRVVGIDISKKMLKIAIKDNSNEKILYKNIPMENLSILNEKFDIVISSLAIHYVKDFTLLVKNVYDILNVNGSFIFSQENPINTCFSSGNRWTMNNDGTVLYANISNYCLDGERESIWFIDNVIKYHRTFSSIINTLVSEKFTVEKLLEPIPTSEVMEKYPAYKRDIHKPDFLLVKVKKSL